MFGNRWLPGSATVVMSETVVSAKAGYAADYVLDVQPADGSSPFRATVRSPRMAGFTQQPDGALVPVEINPKNNEVRFDMSDPQLSLTVRNKNERGAFEATANAPVGTAPVDSPESSSPEPISGSADVTAALARELINTTETLAAIKRARAAGDLAEVGRLKAEWAANNPPSTTT